MSMRDELFKIVVGKLRLPPSAMDELSLHDIKLLLEQYEQDRREFLEGIQMAVAYGIASAHKGRLIPMFEDKNSKPKTQPITSEERKAVVDWLLDGES